MLYICIYVIYMYIYIIKMDQKRCKSRDTVSFECFSLKKYLHISEKLTEEGIDDLAAT